MTLATPVWSRVTGGWPPAAVWGLGQDAVVALALAVVAWWVGRDPLVAGSERHSGEIAGAVDAAGWPLVVSAHRLYPNDDLRRRGGGLLVQDAGPIQKTGIAVLAVTVDHFDAHGRPRFLRRPPATSTTSASAPAADS